ncbi:type I-B CRISPR-associated endonuclease Cas1b [Thermococcus radiotolerans]|uniref:CRISPR-associated endonuclease Cas1 n=1 Tax=Thermococcus radiotolerans TaxID=187880 RepID=A0A2Z2MYX2_9EURY|nr:type I-B CRISPR-associated endonuclease Cas1b [Thermococcus radiotolerans]ASJ13867.1 subtype I-B CRISPR-associated endonuclease Cas1 [Thermococcus radiotolerans]
MKRPLYITKPGILRCFKGTLRFEGEGIKRTIPVKATSEVFCLAPVTLTSGALRLLSREGIPVHCYSTRGNYRGSFIPADSNPCGSTLIAQVDHYLDAEKRCYIATQFIEGIKASMLSLLRSLGIDTREIEVVEIKAETPNELLGLESQLWREFYRLFGLSLKHFRFDGRKRRPPGDEVNAMISYGNAVLYGVILSEIHKTCLNPTVSYLHEPRDGRNSLVFDIADIFKPITVFRVTSRMTNRREIQEEHFKRGNGVYLTDEGKRLLVEGFNRELERKVRHPQLKRYTSVRYIMRLELYSFRNHITGKRKYKSLRAWW